jgi:hypothetical protein
LSYPPIGPDSLDAPASFNVLKRLIRKNNHRRFSAFDGKITAQHEETMNGFLVLENFSRRISISTSNAGGRQAQQDNNRACLRVDDTTFGLDNLIGHVAEIGFQMLRDIAGFVDDAAVAGELAGVMINEG